MVQIWAVMLPLSFAGVAIGSSIIGVPPAELPSDVKVASAVASEILELLAVTWLIQRLTNKYQPRSSSWLQYQQDAAAVGWGFVGAFASLASVFGVQWLMSGRHTSAITGEVREVLLNGSTYTAIGFLGLSGGLVPVVEEYVYRGFLLPSLTKDLPVPAAVVASAVAFSASHLSLKDAPGLFVLGLVLGWLAVAARGNLAAPTLAHAFYNLAIITGLLLQL
eukprot:jgi/Botrbrau1/20655/Bobra.0594s0002.1